MKDRWVWVYPVLLGILTGCAPPVLKQDIPVSSNPVGATVYADGAVVGTTPTRVALPRNQDHVLTLMKDGYRQEDVAVRREYQSDRVLLKAVQSGVDSALFFKNTGMGVQRGLGSISSQESTGEAYRLAPPVVTVTLEPSDARQGATTSPPPVGDLGRTGRMSPSSGDAEAPSKRSIMDASPSAVAGSAALLGASQAKPMEKRWQTSSSTKTSVRPDGTRVTRTSGTSVGVGVDPVGLVGLMTVLFAPE
jgi:hypothetical protein